MINAEAMRPLAHAFEQETRLRVAAAMREQSCFREVDQTVESMCVAAVGFSPEALNQLLACCPAKGAWVSRNQGLLSRAPSFGGKSRRAMEK
jgi:hypothetical protein